MRWIPTSETTVMRLHKTMKMLQLINCSANRLCCKIYLAGIGNSSTRNRQSSLPSEGGVEEMQINSCVSTHHTETSSTPTTHPWPAGPGGIPSPLSFFPTTPCTWQEAVQDNLRVLAMPILPTANVNHVPARTRT